MFFSIDSSDSVLRIDDCLALRKSARGWCLEVGVVVPEVAVVDTGFSVGKEVDAVVGKFELDKSFSLLSVGFRVDNIKIEAGFTPRDFVERTYEGFEYVLLGLFDVARKFRFDRLSNRLVVNEISPCGLVEEMMILFNHHLANFMSENGVGAVYKVGMCDNSYKIGPNYSVEKFGYAYSTSPLRKPEAYFNIMNVRGYLLGEDFVSPEQMPDFFDELDGFDVSKNKLPDQFYYDEILQHVRVVRNFYNSLQKPEVRKDCYHSTEHSIPKKREIPKKDTSLVDFFKNPPGVILKGKGDFDMVLDRLDDFECRDILQVLLQKAPGNPVVREYRSELLKSCSNAKMKELYAYVRKNSSEWISYQWGNVKIESSNICLHVNGGKKSFEFFDAEGLRSVFKEIASKKI